MDEISQEIFNLLKGANYKLRLFTQDGHKTLEPSEASRFYVFEKDLMVTVRQDDGSYEVVIQAGNGFNISDHLDLMDSLKKIVHSHLGNFSVRKFDKTLEPKDFKHQNVQESQVFSRPFGTIKTSYVKAPNRTKLIVKHSKRVDEEKRGSRSRHIHKIFIENKKGEKFSFPYPYVTGAKAMTRHVSEGGTPYDNRGMTILQMCEDLFVMKNMLKGVRHGKLINEENAGTVEHIKETISLIQKGLRNSISKSGYNNVQENILERYLDNDGNHVYNVTTKEMLEEDEHQWYNKVRSAIDRTFNWGKIVPPDSIANRRRQSTDVTDVTPVTTDVTPVTTDVTPVTKSTVAIDNTSSDLIPLVNRAGETVDFPVYLDVNDPFYPQRLRSWMIQHVDSRNYETFLQRKEDYRKNTENKHIENGINIQDIKDKRRYEEDQDRRRRAIERLKALENFGKGKGIGESMDNTTDTTREHFQTRLVSAMLELFKDRANLKMEIDPNDPEHPNNEDPGKYASAMGEVAKLSSLLSFLAMRTKNDEAFGVLTELSERIHDMEPEAMVMVYKMAHAMDKSAQSSPTKTEESTMVSIEESIINTLTSIIR
jgi:hypothetical protein